MLRFVYINNVDLLLYCLNNDYTLIMLSEHMNIKSSENILGILIDTFAVTGRIHLQPLMLFTHSDWLIWR